MDVRLKEELLMAKIIGSPTRYIQGKGELKNIAKHATVIGEKLVVLVDKNIKDIVLPDIEAGMKEAQYEIIEFNGECCMTEINRVKGLFEEIPCENRLNTVVIQCGLFKLIFYIK